MGTEARSISETPPPEGVAFDVDHPRSLQIFSNREKVILQMIGAIPRFASERGPTSTNCSIEGSYEPAPYSCLVP
jgi:hypothetical protein